MTSVVGSVGTPLQKRAPKEKRIQSNKSNFAVNSVANDSNDLIQSSDKSKSDSKLQPTAEQIRIANLMNDKMDDNELKAKIDQIMELTGSSRDDAVVALHDCDNDTAKAIDMILEGDSLDTQWTDSRKKKKPPKTTVSTGDENSKPDISSHKESKVENKDSKQSTNRSEKNNRVGGGRGGGPPRLQRAALANRGQRKTKDFTKNSNEKNETEDQNNDIFSSSSHQPTFRSSDSSAPRRGGDRGGDRRGRGRGGIGRGGNKGAFSGSAAAGRGARTFQNRGIQSNDGFPNSIDTWSNSTADQTSNKTKHKTNCNTMTVGNWSDIAATEDWSEEDWEPNHMETKVFTPSTKITGKEEREVRDMASNMSNNQTSNLSQFMAKSSVDSSQPSMSSILSANLSRNSNVSGQTLLNQLQQSGAGQTPALNQYSLSYNKTATESIKSLVGLTSNSNYNSSNSDLLSNNVRDLDSLSNSQSTGLSNKSRIKQSRPSKIPESAVEMPSNDTIAALGVHFGTLEFGSDNSHFLGTDSSTVFQDNVNHVTNSKKVEANNLSTNSMLSQNNDKTYRPSTTRPDHMNDSTNKVVSSSIIQNSVLGHQSLTSDSLLDRSNKSGVGQYAQKVLDRSTKPSDYSSVSPQQTASAGDITSTYKTTYSSDTPYNSNHYSTNSSNYPYSSNSQSSGFGNYSTNFSNPTIGNHSNSSNQKLVSQLDTNSQQKPYDLSNTMVTNTIGSLGLISTSNVKNTMSSTAKSVHSVPPGVATPVLSTPYIVQNTGVPLYPMGIPYDVQFQTTARDHNFGPYGTQDMKYGRGSDSDVMPVSTSQTVGSQAHNQTFVNTFPPGYGFYLAPGMNMIPAQGIYQTPPIFPVPQPQSTGSAGSAFAKANTTYGSHSYNSGYDSISGTQDYVKQNYQQSVQQHSKGMGGSNASDLSSGQNSSIYGKTHSQINKGYDKQGFQTAPAFNLTGNQSNAMSSTYGAQYVLPHSQQPISLHTMSSLQNDVSQNSGQAVAGQRSAGISHKNPSTGANTYGAKYNWN